MKEDEIYNHIYTYNYIIWNSCGEPSRHGIAWICDFYISVLKLLLEDEGTRSNNHFAARTSNVVVRWDRMADSCSIYYHSCRCPWYRFVASWYVAPWCESWRVVAEISLLTTCCFSSASARMRSFEQGHRLGGKILRSNMAILRAILWKVESSCLNMAGFRVLPLIGVLVWVVHFKGPLFG